MRVKFLVGVVVFSLLVSVSVAIGQGKSKGKGKRKKHDDSSESVRLELTFSVEDRDNIRNWFSDERNLEGLPPGLAKRSELPPGLQRQLVKNGTLPPGLQKKVSPLPVDLERRLPGLPEDIGRVILEGRVILTDRRTNRILDLIEDVGGVVR